PYSTTPTLGAATVADACKYLNGWDGSAAGWAPLANCSVVGNTVTLAAPPGVTIPPLTIADHVNLVLKAPVTNPPTLLATTPSSAEYDFSSITMTGQSSIAVTTDTPYHSVAVYLTGETSAAAAIPTVLDFQGGASASDATFGSVQGCAA